jgi:hypothetical protein
VRNRFSFAHKISFTRTALDGGAAISMAETPILARAAEFESQYTPKIAAKAVRRAGKR